MKPIACAWALHAFVVAVGIMEKDMDCFGLVVMRISMKPPKMACFEGKGCVQGDKEPEGKTLGIVIIFVIIIKVNKVNLILKSFNRISQNMQGQLYREAGGPFYRSERFGKRTFFP